MRVSTDDSVSPSSTRGSREIDPNRRETLEREREREGAEGGREKNNGVGRENGNEESGTKCETWEGKKGMDSHENYHPVMPEWYGTNTLA